MTECGGPIGLFDAGLLGIFFFSFICCDWFVCALRSFFSHPFFFARGGRGFSRFFSHAPRRGAENEKKTPLPFSRFLTEKN